ncbi:MAG: DUF748 domain-containing protein [Chryseolinea sp.]
MKLRLSSRTILFSLLGLIVLLVIADVALSRLAVKKIRAVLTTAGVSVRGVEADVVTRSITIDGFEWHQKNDSSSQQPHSKAKGNIQISVETIHASWIDVVSLIRDKEIRIGSLAVSDGKIVVDDQIFNKPKSSDSTGTVHRPATKQMRLPFNHLSVGSLSLDNIDVIINEDTITAHKSNVNIALKELVLSEPSRMNDINAYTLAGLKVTLKGYQMTAPQSMYTLAVKEMTFDSETKTLNVQSVVLLPKYGKYKFSRRLGKQVDRFILRVPSIQLSDLDMSRIQDSVVTASSLKIRKADLYIFRDKRLPFIKHHNTALPVALIRKLKFGFALDSLLLEDTKITYEEFPEKGFQTGYIVFDHLQANVTKVTNRDLYPGHMQSVLHVSSRVMRNGAINVDFTLPYDKAQIYNARGRISNLRLETLNPILESLAFIRVESGRLNALDFNFSYDDYKSTGNILVNYENLKVTGLAKDKEAKEKDFKSFVLNLFVKKDKDKEVPLEKRSGKIDYERDRRRAIFNVWVKSLFSGVKSSVVDPPAERKPQTRKEKRDSLKQLRKENREKKKKEREERKEDKRTEKSDSVEVISTRN